MATDSSAGNKDSKKDVFDLPAYQKRRFIPEDVDLADAEAVAGLYQELLGKNISSGEALADFVDHRSELDAVLQQEASVLYIKMTCYTDDTEKADAYTKFISEVIPAIKPLADALDRKYLEAKDRLTIADSDFEVYDRTIRSDVDLFRVENVPLQTEDDLLSQEYQAICGKMTVQIDGEEYTMPQAAKLLEQTDRTLRQKAWLATTERRLADADKFDDVFEKMLAVRTKIAANAGFANFRDYQFKHYHRFDYTPDDCKAFHNTAEEIVVPLLGVINKRRCDKMGLAKVRPWDTVVDPLSREPLKPFEDVSVLIEKTGDIFTQIDGELGEQFAEMARMGLLDLASRKGKAPGGYQTTLTEARKPFIFANAVGVNNNIITLLHEGGHAFHAIASADQRLYPYRHATIEFCEVASMSMELLAMPYLSEFYDEQDAKRARIRQLERSA
ncbi:MAG: M3 family oligoendopeptidase, partial [Planctomycetes bacterium]|nr:M3 family oligoendopeptidase [Planctomycetota bacterium]